MKLSEERPATETRRRKWARQFVAEVAWSALCAGAHADQFDADRALYDAVVHEIEKLQRAAGNRPLEGR